MFPVALDPARLHCSLCMKPVAITKAVVICFKVVLVILLLLVGCLTSMAVRSLVMPTSSAGVRIDYDGEVLFMKAVLNIGFPLCLLASVGLDRKVAGFYLVAKNNDTANLSSFFLTASTTATPKGAFWGPSTTGPWTACDTSNGLKCDFGAFNSGATVYVLAAFTLPTGTSTSKSDRSHVVL